MKNPFIACLLSILIPGVGQLYLKEKAKGLSILCITIGLAIAFATNRSTMVLVLLVPLYLFVMIPAAKDAFQTAAGKPKTFAGESVGYVILMLFVVGPFSIPLLWQSHKFPKPVKVILTVVVTLIAIGAIFAMTFLASSFEEAMQESAITLSF